MLAGSGKVNISYSKLNLIGARYFPTGTLFYKEISTSIQRKMGAHITFALIFYRQVKLFFRPGFYNLKYGHRVLWPQKRPKLGIY